MEAIRRIVNADVLMPFMDIPWKSNDMQLEVIIFPWKNAATNKTVTQKKLKGCLKEYANPALWEKESSAWENHIAEKYDTN